MNQIEIVDRREGVMTSLLRGSHTRDIIKTGITQYGVSRATIERDISHCYDVIKTEYQRELPVLISTHIGKYEEIHRSALDGNDHRSAIAALQAIEKLLKLHVDQPLVAIQNNNLDLSGMSLDELKALMHGE